MRYLSRPRLKAGDTVKGSLHAPRDGAALPLYIPK